MGNVTDKNTNTGKQVTEWVSKNMTKNTSEILADNLCKGINKVFCAPFDIAMGLINIIQDRKYSRFIVGVWSVIGASVLVGSLCMYLLGDTFPFNAWSLGVCIASLVVIWIAKHPYKFNVTSELSDLIEEELSEIGIQSSSNSIEEKLSSSSMESSLNNILNNTEDDEELLDIDDDDEDEILDIDDDEELLDIDEDGDEIIDIDDNDDDEELLDIDDVEDYLESLESNLDDLEPNLDIDNFIAFYESSNKSSLNEDLDRYLSDDKNATY